MARFHDSEQRLIDLTGEVLVACPRCSACAVSRQVGGSEPAPFAPRRLTCLQCAHVAEWSGKQIATGDARDPHFNLPLFLQAPCCGDLLWAFNAAHLDFLEDHVASSLRERARGEHGWANGSMASRLPAWITSGKHRAEVLRVIAKLRTQLPADG